ncbi:MAG: hypothetical protein LBQ66_07515 [Planctomycetaceae bacterium]|nr:hypothetical protein [Planctomycetaceae bacterium]
MANVPQHVLANVLQHVLAFLPNLFGYLMHRGGRDARVPVRRRFAGNFVLLREMELGNQLRIG